MSCIRRSVAVRLYRYGHEPQAGDGDQLLTPPYCYSKARSRLPLNSMCLINELFVVNINKANLTV